MTTRARNTETLPMTSYSIAARILRVRLPGEINEGARQDLRIAAMEGPDAVRAVARTIAFTASGRDAVETVIEAITPCVVEGLVNGQWAAEHAGAPAHEQESAPRAELEAALPNLARTLGCDVSALRVVPAPVKVEALSQVS